MKKKSIAVIFLLASLHHVVQAQSSPDGNAAKSYVGDINQMFTAAPTSNNLMKFEEVPVSYYTGIPDVSLPLVSLPTNNSKVGISVQLKYHPLNAKPDDRSGETGLGWSLIAGGTISRTIRGGGVDEKNITIAFSSPAKVKYGIYNELYNPTGKLMRDEPYDENEYKYVSGLGRYDSEYDLYQYNFMGQSGRFYIAKDAAGNFKVEKLDKNNLQVVCTPDAQGAVNLFTIVDDKGIRYTFSPMEKSQKTVTTIKTGLVNLMSSIDSNIEMGNYWSSFHLTKIEDQQNNTLAVFKYELSSVVKFEETPTVTNRLASNVYYYNQAFNNNGILEDPDGSMPGAIESQTVNNNTLTMLLTSIEVTGRGTIYFNYEKGRQDSNYREASELYKLKSVQSNIIGQSISQYTDKYVLDYGYTNTAYLQTNNQMKTEQKMLLTQVTKISPNTQNQEYKLEYTLPSTDLTKDGWGYYQGSGSGSGVKTDVLKSLTYPTRGKVAFDFGENIYSYTAGTEPVTGHWVDQDNSFDFSELLAFSPTVKSEFFTIKTPQKVKLHLDLVDLIYSNWRFDLYKKNPDNTYSASLAHLEMSWQSCISTSGAQCASNTPGMDGEPTREMFLETGDLQPGTYYVSLTGSYGLTKMPIFYILTASTKEHYFMNYLTKKGGGLRINNIKYFDSLVATVPAKQFMYDYRDIDNPLKSSGALVFPEPVTHFVEGYSFNNKFTFPDLMYSANFDVKTNYNILPVQKTNGSDVGYKYVTVQQLDKDDHNKGKTVYTYRSPQDYPNTSSLSLQLPVRAVPNEDYLRGQMISEKKYNEAGQILSESTTDYTTSEFTKNDGVKLIDNYYSSMISQSFKYTSYQVALAQTGVSISLTTPFKNFEKFGVTLPSKKTETSYFYKNGVQSSVVTTTNTTYNPEDYPISVTQSILGGDTYVSGYKYAKEKLNQKLITANMLNIPLETESKKNGQTLSKTETKFDHVDNLFPSSVSSYNLQTGVATTELTYEKYSPSGNLQQYRTKDGIPVSIIWGYNNTQPIAKIVGLDYATVYQLAGSSLTGFIAASDTDASAAAGGDEVALLSAMDAFRNALAGGELTTYTYDPLVGVRTITQALGTRALYYYDSANRLKEIKQLDTDASGNTSLKTVKEFQYNYKN